VGASSGAVTPTPLGSSARSRGATGDPEPRPSPSASSRGARWLLGTGGWLAAVMGAAHFVLPVLYPWATHVEGLYPPVRWALFATTFFFGILLVLGGLLVVAVGRARDLSPGFAVGIVGGMAAFWILGTIYEVVVPFPDAAARWPLSIFSAVLAVLHLAGLRSWLRARTR
jgi:hypothetical protein